MRIRIILQKAEIIIYEIEYITNLNSKIVIIENITHRCIDFVGIYKTEYREIKPNIDSYGCYVSKLNEWS